MNFLKRLVSELGTRSQLVFEDSEAGLSPEARLTLFYEQADQQLLETAFKKADVAEAPRATERLVKEVKNQVEESTLAQWEREREETMQEARQKSVWDEYMLALHFAVEYGVVDRDRLLDELRSGSGIVGASFAALKNPAEWD